MRKTLLMLLSLGVITASASADTWGLTKGLVDTIANGGTSPDVWSYGYRTSDTGAITPYARLDTGFLGTFDLLSGGTSSYADQYGNVTYHTLATDRSEPAWPHGMYWYAQSAHMMIGGPDPNQSNRPVYRFTAPNAGEYEIDVTYRNCSSTGASTYIHVVANDVVIFTDDLSGFGADANATSTYTGSVTLAAGETIEFTQSAYNATDAPYHIAAIDAAITTVPEPITLGLLAAGGGLAFLRRRQ